MFGTEDNTYNEIRERSLMQWLSQMEEHDDLAVRGGVKLCREYVQHLKDVNERQKQEMQLKDQDLRKMKQSRKA